MIPNKKKVLVVERMAPAAWNVLNERPDVEAVEFKNFLPAAEFNALLKQHAPVHGIALGAMTFGRDEVASAGGMRVLGRVGVGYDSVDVTALNDGNVALMTTGIANSPSVAECALFMMMALAKRSVELDALVKTGRWKERMVHTPFDLLGKTVVVIGFGRIGSRLVKRLVAMEMSVLVYDPFKSEAEIKAVGAHYITDLDKALPDADFVSVNCPKNKETANMFNATRLALLKRTAYFVNTARGGLVDEIALYEALSTGKLAGAGLDVFEQEPPSNDHPLLKLSNVVTAPHVAGVTKESLERMGVQTMHNILSLLDDKPIRENVINPEVLGLSRAGASAMPLQNRVTPFGEIIATADRGRFTGNRGIIHDPATRTLLNRRWSSKAWITCVCEFRGRRRKVMAARSWTELFFLDEATSFAAGHRPCFYCRRADAVRFRDAWARGNGRRAVLASEMDEVLHYERLEGRKKRLHVLPTSALDLPNGTMVAVGEKSFLIKNGAAWLWSFAGYTPSNQNLEDARLLNPPSVVRAFAAGYTPTFHEGAFSSSGF